MRKFILSLVLILTTTIMVFGNINKSVYQGITFDEIIFSIDDIEETYYYNGNEYDVFIVNYGNNALKLKIGVYDNCYIAFNNEHTIFYNCDSNGFGVRRLLSHSPSALKKLDARKFQKQTILIKKGDVSMLDALGLIACYYPELLID